MKTFFDSMIKTRTFGLAAETAFWLFLSLIPLAAVAGLVAAKLARANWQAVVPFLAALPPVVRELINNELSHVSAWDGGSVGVTGTVVFVWLGSSGVHAIFDAFEIETGTARPWWKKRAFAIATCIGLSLGVALLTFIGPGIEALEELLGRLSIDESTTIVRVLRAVLGIGVSFVMVAGLYWIGIPPPVRQLTPILPGAALAVSIQIVLGVGYRFYLSTMGDGGAYQAGLAVIGITLTALYLLSIALLAGALLNLQFAAKHQPPPPQGSVLI